MFEKEAKKHQIEVIAKRDYPHCISVDWQRGAEYGYNKCKEEMQKNGLALQSDMDRTIEQNMALKKELEKTKWHKVSEQVPTEEKNYLVKLTDGAIDVMAIAPDGNLEPYLLTPNFDFYKDVEKWCEIPEDN